LPIPVDVKQLLDRGGTGLDRDATEIVWETLCDRTKDFGAEHCEIEPGELDEFIFDFVIPLDVRKVQFYSHVQNVTKRKRNVGWNTSTIYDVSNGKENEHVVP
jgi:hypothetical protein